MGYFRPWIIYSMVFYLSYAINITIERISRDFQTVCEHILSKMVRKPLQAARSGISNTAPVHVNFGPMLSLVKEWNISGQVMGRREVVLSLCMRTPLHLLWAMYMYCITRMMLIGTKLKAFSSSSFMFAWPLLNNHTPQNRVDWWYAYVQRFCNCICIISQITV